MEMGTKLPLYSGELFGIWGCLNSSLDNVSLKSWFFKIKISTNDTTFTNRSAWQKGSSFSPSFLMNVLKFHWSQQLSKAVARAVNTTIKCVKKGECQCTGLQLMAPKQPHVLHLLGILDNASVEFTRFCTRQLSVILGTPGLASVVACCQRWALVACCLPSSCWQAGSQAELWRTVQPFPERSTGGCCFV